MDFKKIGLFLGGALAASSLQFATPIADRIYQNFTGNNPPRREGVEAKAAAQYTYPYTLIAWVTEEEGQDRLKYSIIDSDGSEIVTNKIGLHGSSDVSNYRICGIHRTGNHWIVIVDDGENTSDREIYAVTIDDQGNHSSNDITNSAFTWIGDVASLSTSGQQRTGGCW